MGCAGRFDAIHPLTWVACTLVRALRRFFVVAGVVLGGWLAAASAAMACGPTGSDPIVQSGHIPGQRWSQGACLISHRRLEVDFSLPQPDGEDYGDGMLRPLPSARELFLDLPKADLGTHQESEIDGVVGSTITRLRLTFASGQTLTVATRLAPARLRQRFVYLRHLRFFVDWFAANSGIPEQVCGLHGHGHLGPCFRHAANGQNVYRKI